MQKNPFPSHIILLLKLGLLYPQFFFSNPEKPKKRIHLHHLCCSQQPFSYPKTISPRTPHTPTNQTSHLRPIKRKTKQHLKATSKENHRQQKTHIHAPELHNQKRKNKKAQNFTSKDHIKSCLHKNQQHPKSKKERKNGKT